MCEKMCVRFLGCQQQPFNSEPDMMLNLHKFHPVSEKRISLLTCPTMSSLRLISACAVKNRRICVVNAHQVKTQGLIQQSDVDDIRNVVASTLHYSIKGQRIKESGNPVADFVSKVRVAWSIFFPAPIKAVSPKEEVKKRLRMVLVADRCGMSPASLSEMKKTIVKALQEFVDIEAEDAIEVSISTEPEMGTVYSVNIPVRRVKPEARFGPTGLPEGEVAEGISLEWDPTDWNSDPSARFPMGC